MIAEAEGSHVQLLDRAGLKKVAEGMFPRL